ncbi:MAG TPA: hypothetical protein PLD20_16485 [Blastocatellia bacterium]|nr:hypothetical protein [Blastocatellia bacterium]HMZ19536.1 hypothetical protein [Blastocatellia bacterium]
MLRITIHNEDAATRLQVEGKLVGAWVEELKVCWQSLASSGRALLVDLSALTLIDADGKALLAEMHRQGARLAAIGLMTQAIIEEITQEAKL